MMSIFTKLYYTRVYRNRLRQEKKNGFHKENYFKLSSAVNLCYNFINLSVAAYISFTSIIQWKTAFIFRLLSAKIALKAVCLIKI